MNNDEKIEAAIKRLRTHSGGWNGDKIAREVLAELVKSVQPRPLAILDHNNPARVACDSSPQKTFMARMHAADHALDSVVAARATYNASLDRAIERPAS